MEQRISDYIMLKINEGGGPFGKGNLIAYNILINVSYEMLINNKSEEEIKEMIDSLVIDPVKKHKQNG